MPASRKFGEASAAHGGIRIAHCGKDTLDARGDDGVGTRAGAADMRAGFEIEVERRTPRALPSLFNGENLSVLLAFVSVGTAANDTALWLTSTAPTRGLGEARAMPCRARSRACCMNCSSEGRVLEV